MEPDVKKYDWDDVDKISSFFGEKKLHAQYVHMDA